MNVLILGAGFSSPAGIPGMDSFVPDVLSQWEAIVRTAGLRSEEAAQFRGSIESLWKRHGKPDIEQLLERVEKSPEDRRRVTRFIKIALSGLARRYIRNELRPVRRRMLDADYEAFVRYLEVHRPAIISFNYDLVCEYLIREVLRWKDDHRVAFDRVAGADAGGAAGNAVSTGGWGRPPSGESIPVLKPQGSVSWTRCPNCGMAEDHVRHVTDQLLSEPPRCPRCGSVPEPLISFSAGGPRRRSVLQLEETWEEVERVLAAAKTACVCGLSLRQEHVRFREAVMRRAGGAKRLRRLTLIDPDERARERVSSLFDSALGVDREKAGHRKERRSPFGRRAPVEEEPEAAEETGIDGYPGKPEPPAAETGPPKLSVESYESLADWAMGMDAG